jgi:PIN domain nuclease of toxin-antitoxin system
VQLLLDAHAVLWALYEPKRIPSSLAATLESPASELYVSDASIWELLDKAAKGRLPLAGREPKIILQRVSELGLRVVAITQEDIVASVSLPQHHGDPFDRMIVAQAQRRGFTVVTVDRRIGDYPVPILWE